MVASKYDELDENIPLISDLQRIMSSSLSLNEQTPTFTDIVECERAVMRYFDWDLMMLMPSHFVKNMLSNGVLFENESGVNADMAKRIANRCL